MGKGIRTYCGADCSRCSLREDCKGCCETCGKPFGGKCIAAEYIKAGGIEGYNEFKSRLKSEINDLLCFCGIPKVENLYELAGRYVNLTYSFPNKEKSKILDDCRIYLGCQIEFADMGICYGVVADMDFILVCSYGENGSDPELIAYKKR